MSSSDPVTSVSSSLSSTRASDPLASFPQIPVDNTLGAWFIGAFFSVFLSGITYLQAYQYWRAFPKDHRSLKIWVVIAMYSLMSTPLFVRVLIQGHSVLETFSTILVLHTSYHYAVTLFWDPAAVLSSPPVWQASSFRSSNLFCVVLTLRFKVCSALTGNWVCDCLDFAMYRFTSSFFARRVWIMSPKFRPVVISVMLLMLGYIACFIVLSIRMFRVNSIPDLFKFSVWLFYHN
ncbi:hypothetical protein GSI_12086 [Ganoderma sinense ZZ0214-1]|uniref:Uncharacterized protein n=1 Tax=Ganoderma sinense ZZ0214-1 TaxID=1077348 RepID=A0A2G8RXT7_9APHY|nr:hypothetical protein GSI_12086 [Ganoderma sinense ZZ0214-1]